MHVPEGEGGEVPGGLSEGGEQGERGDLFLWEKVAPNIKGKEYIVSVAYVWGLERHHPTIIMLWGHGDQVKRRSEYMLTILIINSNQFNALHG